MNGRKKIATAAVAAIATVTVATAFAAPANRTFSAGQFELGFGGSESVSKGLKVKPRGTIKDINVEVALQNQQNSDYVLLLQHPTGKTIHLSSGNGGTGNGYGSGQGCGSTVTFDDDATNDIEDTEGINTLLFGSYQPEEVNENVNEKGLDDLVGLKLNGKWRLVATNTEPTGVAELECFKIEAKYKTAN